MGDIIDDLDRAYQAQVKELRAENERLRDALEALIDWATHCPPIGLIKQLDVVIEKARAALEK